MSPGERDFRRYNSSPPLGDESPTPLSFEGTKRRMSAVKMFGGRHNKKDKDGGLSSSDERERRSSSKKKSIRSGRLKGPSLERENSAVCVGSLVRDPREEIEPTHDNNHIHNHIDNHNNNHNNSGSSNRRSRKGGHTSRGDRPTMERDNSAVNRPSINGDPRYEMMMMAEQQRNSGSEKLSRVSEDTDDAPTPPRNTSKRKGGNKSNKNSHHLSSSEGSDRRSGRQATTTPQSPFANYIIEDDPQQCISISSSSSTMDRRKSSALISSRGGEMQKSSFENQRNRRKSANDEPSVDSEGITDDVMPLTRPSEPSMNRRRNRRSNRSSAFDVEETRASLIATLKNPIPTPTPEPELMTTSESLNNIETKISIPSSIESTLASTTTTTSKPKSRKSRQKKPNNDDNIITNSMISRVTGIGVGGDISASMMHRLQDSPYGADEETTKPNHPPETIHESLEMTTTAIPTTSTPTKSRKKREKKQNDNITTSMISRVAGLGVGGDISESFVHRLQESPPEKEKKKEKNRNQEKTASSLVAIKEPSLAAARRDSYKSSMIITLSDMGFNIPDIEQAITETNASSSEDAAKVVEWLSEHEEVGSGNKSTSPPNQLDDSINIDGSDHDSCDDDHTLQTKRTHTSAATNGTTETEESNELVKELGNSLKDLGFSKVDIKQKKELYRRHSDKMQVQEFICAMLEVEDEIKPNNHDSWPNSRSSSAPATSSSWKTSSSPPRKKTSDDNNTPPTKGSGRKKIDDSDRSIDINDLSNEAAIIDSISEMGFEKGQVKSTINDMQRSRAKIDVDSVLTTLLSGGGDGSSPTSQSSRYSHSTGEINNITRQQKSSSRPKAYEDHDTESDETTTIGSIEITPGQFAKLLKGKQTWNALHNGTAISTPCIICTAILQCCPEADYVLCPDCNVVSSLQKDDIGNTHPPSLRGSTTRSSDTNSRRSMGKCVGSVGLGYKK